MQDIVISVMLFGSVSLLSAVLAVVVTTRFCGMHAPVRRAAAGPVFADTPRRYEFREGYLLSAIDPNDAFLPDHTDRSAAFDVLSRGLAALNPDLPGRFAALARRGEAFVLAGVFGADALTVAGRAEADRLVVTIGPTEPGGGRQVIEGPVLLALQLEAQDQRLALDLGRAAIWKQDDQGRILWANGPYLALVERLAGDDPEAVTWPVPALFADHLHPLPEPGSLRRCRLSPPGAEARADPDDGASWFELSACRHEGGVLVCATPVDRLIAAETALRNFVQTLSKTFAHLPIGLAIFDKRRELMLFNPALVTLSTLSPEFLSLRPGLVAFLDALRDRQRMPEPKNYRTWRDDIARLEQRAEQGTYQELWTLASGQSLRVIGRPHPDGAVAFMFEDITSEVSLTRKFRGDLDLFQAVLDDTAGALAVFSGEGRLVLANAAYGALWGGDVKDLIGTLSLAEATRHWQGGSATSQIWGAIRRFAAQKSDRAVWADAVVLRDGRQMAVRVAPIAGGAISVRFLAPDPAALPDTTGLCPTLSSTTPALRGVAEPPAEFQSRRTASD